MTVIAWYWWMPKPFPVDGVRHVGAAHAVATEDFADVASPPSMVLVLGGRGRGGATAAAVAGPGAAAVGVVVCVVVVAGWVVVMSGGGGGFVAAAGGGRGGEPRCEGPSTHAVVEIVRVWTSTRLLLCCWL